MAGIENGQVKALTDSLRRMPARIRPMAQAVVEKTSADIERDGKIKAPVDTGNLKSSIGREVKELEAEIGPTANYGIYLELGTSRMAAQPYMGPAADLHTPAFEAAMTKIAEEALDG